MNKGVSAMSEDRVFRITSKLGIVFEKASLNDVGKIAGSLQKAGVPHEVSQHITDRAIFIEIDPGLASEGIPVSTGFVKRVASLGGRFCGGNGIASLLNRIGRSAPNPA